MNAPGIITNPEHSAALTAAWQNATRADRHAEIVKTAAASQAAVDAWREFRALAEACERRAA